MTAAVSEAKWQAYFMYKKDGLSDSAASAKAGISRSVTARAKSGVSTTPEYRRARAIFEQLHPKAPVTEEEIEGSDAALALKDFDFFRRRYLGRVSVPWATYTANLIVELLASPNKEYIVVNQPPGVGKSSLWTMDLPLWLICRNRGIRIMVGSAAQSTAANNTQQMRRELERQHPVLAPDELARKGLAVDAVATLPQDFGNFRPPRGEPWTAEQFVVVQDKDVAKRNKEPTVSAYGMDSRFLGQRCDFIVWDDVVDAKSVNSPEKREQIVKWWEQYAETRLEPGGLLVLQGQRLHAEDLYHHVINIEVGDYGDEDDENDEPVGVRKQYRHITFKAHYDDHCKGEHKTSAPAYDPANPDGSGCLLDPRRLRYRNLMEVKDKDNRLYTVTYQQEDVDPESVLVPALWIAGGRDPETGEQFPGCWDKERSTGVVPKNLTRPWLSVVTADPSPSKFWSIQWWVVHLPTEQRFLIDHARKAMGANDFLDLISGTDQYVGLLEEWWQVSKQTTAPITTVIVERNAAQRFLLQYDFVRTWQRTRQVKIIAHDTYANKSHPEFGVKVSLPQQYRFGRVRLPSGDQLSRGRSMALVNEVTRWPESSTDDCVMAHWFLEFNLPALRREVERPPEIRHEGRPSWLLGRRAA